MKKHFIAWLMLLALLFGGFNLVTKAEGIPSTSDYESTGAKEAGFTYEQYRSILEIPEIPPVEDLGENEISTYATSPTDQQKVVNETKKYLGVPYVWGGTSPSGFDCSGLVQYVYSRAVGISLPRVTYQQEYSGKEIGLNSLSPGDLLFYGTRGTTHHVAIYIGNGQAIHAPQPGDVVRIYNISSFYPSFARRVLNDNYNPGPAIYANLEIVNLNSSGYKIGGWMTSDKNFQNTIPFVFFMDATTGKEIVRQKADRHTRTDVGNAYPTVNGARVGWQAEAPTPEKLLGKKYKIMVRYASDSNGNVGVIEKYFETIYIAPSKVNTGAIDVFSAEGNSQKIIGWHASWNMSKAKYGFIILLENGKEVRRAPIGWIIERPDVEAAVGTAIYNSRKSGFGINIDVSGLRGKTVTILHRYTNNPNGNDGVSDYYYPETYKL